MRRAVVIGLAALLAGCLDEDPLAPEPDPPVTGAVKLVVRPKWNGADFDKLNVYLSAANERVMIQQVKFYLSGITLLNGSGEVLASPVELVDITNGPEVRVLSDVEVGAYFDLRFGLGLPPELNHQDITQVVPPSPLDFSQGMYWSWATMYRFMIFEGRFDTDTGATGTPPFQFSIHTGRDECYRERTMALPLNVVEGDTAWINLDVDLANFFTDGQEVLVFAEGSQSHGAVQELPLAEALSDLAVKAINAP